MNSASGTRERVKVERRGAKTLVYTVQTISPGGGGLARERNEVPPGKGDLGKRVLLVKKNEKVRVGRLPVVRGGLLRVIFCGSLSRSLTSRGSLRVIF